MLDKETKLILSVTLAILGLALGLQFRSTLTMTKEKQEAVQTVEERKKQLDDEIQNSNRLKEQIKAMEKQKEQYIKDSTNGTYNAANDYLKKQLDDVMVKAGLTDVKGSGIIIKLNDAPSRKNINVSNLIVHDSDIIRVLNELKIAGAQAISINDERVISTSEQVCAGPTIRINKNRYAVPFVIKAIGNADQLEKGFTQSSTYVLLTSYGIRVNVEKAKEILIKEYANSIDQLTSGLEVAKQNE